MVSPKTIVCHTSVLLGCAQTDQYAVFQMGTPDAADASETPSAHMHPQTTSPRDILRPIATALVQPNRSWRYWRKVSVFRVIATANANRNGRMRHMTMYSVPYAANNDFH